MNDRQSLIAVLEQQVSHSLRETQTLSCPVGAVLAALDGDLNDHRPALPGIRILINVDARGCDVAIELLSTFGDLTAKMDDV
ncbi:hypothetical protein CVUC_07765 [Caulobacter vibrioides]|nr:hypothetical protein CA608_00495 [Caulobacter vibrioides]PLR13210.1 hypothetical protein CVUC_07765 [Caulobacter vibrioides]